MCVPHLDKCVCVCTCMLYIVHVCILIYVYLTKICIHNYIYMYLRKYIYINISYTLYAYTHVDIYIHIYAHTYIVCCLAKAWRERTASGHLGHSAQFWRSPVLSEYADCSQSITVATLSTSRCGTNANRTCRKLSPWTRWTSNQRGAFFSYSTWGHIHWRYWSVDQ